jgi:PHP family Zn ribbon phosphoesterase
VKEWQADLHIHTCLSPCAERGMSPAAVVRESCIRGLHVIAVCDHNSAENVKAARAAARNTGLAVLGGMEICTKEEVHVLGIFDKENALGRAQDIVYENLSGENDPETFGEQVVMNERGEVIGYNTKLLIGATSLSLAEAVRTIHDLGGIAIASHVDRPSFSVISQLGFIPADLGLDGAEVCSGVVPEMPERLAVIRSSDAHRPEEIGKRRTSFLLEKPAVVEIQMALHRIDGRRILT